MSDSSGQKVIEAFVKYAVERDDYNHWWMEAWLISTKDEFFEEINSSSTTKTEVSLDGHASEKTGLEG